MDKKEFQEEEQEQEENTSEEEDIEKAADILAKKVYAKLDLKALEEKINKTIGKGNTPDARNVVSKIFNSGDLKKGVSELTKEEKIVGFFQGLLHDDAVVLKALSEGVAADGGYLFPDEFRAELIKGLAEPTRMRGLVRVVPMKRDVMKIPKLSTRPEVRWTSENAASLFNGLRVCTSS